MNINKKVLFLRSGYGTPDSRLEKEIHALSSRGAHVEVLAWDRDAEIDKQSMISINGEQIQFYHIGIKSQLGAGFKKNLYPMFRFIRKMYQFIVKHGMEYDVIHASDFDTMLPAMLACKKTNAKIVYDIYDYYADSHHMPNVLDKLLRAYDTYFINKADAVIVCSEERMAQIEPAKPKNLVVIHNTPSNQLIEPLVESSHEKIRIIYIGWLIESGRFVREMVDVISKHPKLELYIGGFGPIENVIKEYSEQYSNIVFLGKLAYSDVLKYESQCDIMTAIYDSSLKNHRYAAPNKFYEALMLGKPLIVVNNTGIDQVVVKENIGWSIDAASSEEFMLNFDALLSEIEKTTINVDEIKERERQLYIQKYSWDIMEQRLLELYNSL